MEIKWGKVVLIFQAVVTLIIGMIMFYQFITVATARLTKLSELNPREIEPNNETYLGEFREIESRFKIASYIVVLVSLIELIILFRLFN